MNFRDKLQFILKNKATDTPLTIALASGGVPVEGVLLENDATSGTSVVTLHHHNTAPLLKAGYAVDTVLDDMTANEVAAGGIAFGPNSKDYVYISTVDSSLSIHHALAYLHDNPRQIRRIIIDTNNKAVFNSSLSICSVSPFHRENERQFNLSDYFSVNQYQENKINIDFDPNQLQWNDQFYMSLNGMPAQTEVRIVIEFYEES